MVDVVAMPEVGAPTRVAPVRVPAQLTPLFSLTAFLGAGLLFLVQPMVAHQLLPLFGGSAMVWNTASMFFQLTLLAGYALTHLGVTRLGVRRHARLEVALVLLPLATLPIGLSSGAEPGSGPPVVRLLVLLAGAVAAPFLVLSTGGPLLQRWFAATHHPRADDPYFLFAAGNAGSFVALVGYPLVVAPHVTVHRQLVAWSVLYAGWAVLVVLCALAVRRPRGPRPPAARAPRAPRGQELRWVVTAALPSSLMLGTTTYLSTDLAPVPLLWVVPLGLYLLTFVVAFGWSTERARRVAPRLALAVPVLLLPCLVLPGLAGVRITLAVPLYLALFTAVAAAAHTRLSAERPPVEGLTRFYLLLAVGGALGGVANGLLAPVLFNRMYEFPLALAASLLLLPRPGRPSWLGRRYGLLGAALLAAGVFVGPLLLRAVVLAAQPAPVVALVVAGTVALVLRRHPRALALGVGLVLVVPLLVQPTLAATRSYFGVATVVSEGTRHKLQHGTTVHGWQDLQPSRRHLAQSYYERSGPIGQLLGARQAVLAHGTLGVVGLGSGALAAYGQPGETIHFFEIDQQVVRIARDPRLFTYLEDSPAGVRVTLGDGRLTLAREPARSFDVLVLDAFTSDAVPVHLLTREAVHLYLSRVRDGGVVAFHVSNRYLDLERVLADVAAAEGAVGLAQDHPGDRAAGGLPSRWVVLARTPQDLADLRADPRWVPLERLRSGHRPWTDDYSDLFGALRR